VSPVPLIPHHGRRRNLPPTRTGNDRASRVRLAVLPFRSSVSTSRQCRVVKTEENRVAGRTGYKPRITMLIRRSPRQAQRAPSSGLAQVRILPSGAVTCGFTCGIPPSVEGIAHQSHQVDWSVHSPRDAGDLGRAGGYGRRRKISEYVGYLPGNSRTSRFSSVTARATTNGLGSELPPATFEGNGYKGPFRKKKPARHR
jgi:hypothetical protein